MLEYFLRNSREVFQVLFLVGENVRYPTAHQDSAEKGEQDTDDLGGGESFHRTQSKIEQDEGGQQRSYVCIQYRRQRTLVSFLDRRNITLAFGQFFLDAFVDDYVRIHGHTDGQNQTGNTGSRQRSAQTGENANGEEQVQDQGDVGNPTTGIVIHQHQGEDHNERDQEGHRSTTDRFATEGRPYLLLLNNLGRGGELTDLQDVCQVGCFLLRIASGDRGNTIRDGADHVRSRLNDVIQYDRNGATDVLFRQLFPDGSALWLHAHLDLHLAILVEILTGIGDRIAFQFGIGAVVCFQGI